MDLNHEQMTEGDFEHCASAHCYVPVIHAVDEAFMVKLLHQHGVDINAVDDSGNTALIQRIKSIKMARQMMSSGS